MSPLRGGRRIRATCAEKNLPILLAVSFIGSATGFLPIPSVGKHIQLIRRIAASRCISPITGDFSLFGKSSISKKHCCNVRMDTEWFDDESVVDHTILPIRFRKSEQKTPSVVVLGLSHKTASVGIREKLAVPEAEWQEAGRNLIKLPSVSEAAILSTCNRFEIYFVTDCVHQGIREVTEQLSRRSKLSVSELREHLFVLRGDDAVWHGLRVAGGLDSMVLGEGQILAQMKRCHELASAARGGAAGKLLSRLLTSMVAAGKRVRAETDIAKGGVSVSSAAVQLVAHRCARDLGLPLADLDVCIVGAGKMAKLLVQHLAPRRPRSITILNRSPDRAHHLAAEATAAAGSAVAVRVAGMDQLLDRVTHSHVTFACTSATEPILTEANLAAAFAAAAPAAAAGGTMLVDLCVPRNIDAAGARRVRPHVRACYDVDDLQVAAADASDRRRRLVPAAEALLREELAAFSTWRRSLAAAPTIARLTADTEEVRRAEVERVAGRLSGLSACERAAVEQATKRIVAKLLHAPITRLRAAAAADAAAAAADWEGVDGAIADADEGSLSAAMDSLTKASPAPASRRPRGRGAPKAAVGTEGHAAVRGEGVRRRRR